MGLFRKFPAEGGQATKSASPEAPASSHCGLSGHVALLTGRKPRPERPGGGRISRGSLGTNLVSCDVADLDLDNKRLRVRRKGATSTGYTSSPVPLGSGHD